MSGSRGPTTPLEPTSARLPHPRPQQRQIPVDRAIDRELFRFAAQALRSHRIVQMIAPWRMPEPGHHRSAPTHPARRSFKDLARAAGAVGRYDRSPRRPWLRSERSANLRNGRTARTAMPCPLRLEDCRRSPASERPPRRPTHRQDPPTRSGTHPPPGSPSAPDADARTRAKARSSVPKSF